MSRTAALRAAQALTEMTEFFPPTLTTTALVSSLDGKIDLMVHNRPPIVASARDARTLARWLFGEAGVYETHAGKALGRIHHTWTGRYAQLPVTVSWIEKGPAS